MKNKKQKEISIIPSETIENKIFLIRGFKVMLDSDLAVLYGVETKTLNRAVSRNIKRFPNDFMFQLKRIEFENLRFQIGTSNYGGRRYLPYVFTEQGVAMLSGVLNSQRAIEVNIQIIRTFVKLREMIISNKELRMKIENIEKKYDKKFSAVFDALRKLLRSDPEKVIIIKRKIGFEYKIK